MFNLNPASGVPIYRQLVDQIKRLIAGGQLREGDNLPSVRDLAQTHAINPMTISKAYSLLENEGILVRVRGKPMQVAAGRPGKASSVQQALQEPLEQLVAAARQLHLSDTEIEQLVVDFLAKGQKRDD